MCVEKDSDARRGDEEGVKNAAAQPADQPAWVWFAKEFTRDAQDGVGYEKFAADCAIR